MSWPPRDKSSGPPIYRASGLLSSETAKIEQQSQDRPRLPPLSTLLASSSSSSSSSSHHATSSSLKLYPHHGPLSSVSARTERSPLASHTTISSSHTSSPTLDKYATADTFYRRPPPPHQPQRSSSASLPVNLPPLTSLSLRSRGSRSPPPSTSQQLSTSIGNELLPPRLPSPAYGTADRRRPSHGHLDSSLSSASSSVPGIGPIRRRVTSAVPMSAPYRRHSPVYDQEYFGNVWDIYTYACRLNDDATPRDQQSYPPIASGDIQSLIYHLHGELDRLERRNPRLSFQLAQDAGLTKHRQASTSSSSSSTFHRTTSRNTSGDQHPHHQHEDKRTPSDDMEMSSSSGSFTSPTMPIYASGLPAYAHSESSSTSYHHQQQQHHHHRRRLSASGRSPQQSYTSPHGHHQHHQQSLTSGSSTSVANLPPPKRVRKRKDETDQSCLCCSATETPEWRKGPTGPRTLCNACGLLFAKQCRKKEMEAQARGERPRGSRPPGPEIMSADERQRSLAELRVAVNARANASPPM